MCDGRFYFTVFRSLSTNPKVKELLKSVHICQSYRKNKCGTFFMADRVVKTTVVVYFSDNFSGILSVSHRNSLLK